MAQKFKSKAREENIDTADYKVSFVNCQDIMILYKVIEAHCAAKDMEIHYSEKVVLR